MPSSSPIPTPSTDKYLDALPEWARDLSYLTAFMSYSAFLGECDLSVERRRYEDLIAHAEEDLL